MTQRNKPPIFAVRALLGMCALLPCAAQAQDGTANTPAERKAAQSNPVMTGKEDSADKQFLMKAVQGNLAEIRMGQLALKNSADINTKNYANRMIEDHTTNNNQALAIIAKKGMTAPKSPDAKSIAMMRRMSKMKSGFNKMYITHMIADHKEDIAEYTKEAKTGYDDDIKGYAVTALPTLKSHLDYAQTLMNPTRGAITPANTRKNPTSRPGQPATGAGAAAGGTGSGQ